VLASQSPRRRRLLGWLGLPFRSTSVDTPEELDSPLASDPSALAAHLASEKALAARTEEHAESELLLCFDTIVVLDGETIGKPADIPDAWRMLRALSGRTHDVVTGVAALCPGDEVPRAFAVTTPVRMRELSDADIENWMTSGEFMGCAGAYNIEAQIADVSLGDCYQNVAGLPLCHVFAMLAEMPECLSGARPASPVGRCDAALGRSCALGPRLTAAGLAYAGDSGDAPSGER
jgi:septum formation protein